MSNFSTKIYNARKQKNLTQKELSDLLSVRQTTVSAWETGKVVPRLPMVFNLANVLDIKVVELLELLRQDSDKESA
jgi:transcriptional regulator with XRE-family HTH domain